MTAGLCGEKDRATCEEEFGDNLDWACEHCDKRRMRDLAPYTHKLLNLDLLQAAGYPLAADDLTLDEWRDLGRLKRCLEALRMPLR